MLQKQPQAAIINVSSGLAFRPLALTPTYCATKAAIHSYTQSLRYQLRATQIEVIELIPPYVATHLMGGADDPRAMPLDKFIAEVMQNPGRRSPRPAEICVENVKGLRFAAESGRYEAVFAGLNAARPDGPLRAAGGARGCKPSRLPASHCLYRPRVKTTFTVVSTSTGWPSSR